MITVAAQLLTTTTVTVAVTSMLIWISRAWISERLKNAIKAEYDQKLETHKAQLKAQSDVEIERLRSQLNMAAAEHQVRFSGLHEKRAEVIGQTYSLLQSLYDALGNYVNIIELEGTPNRHDRRKVAVESSKAFSEYYLNRRIFLPKATAGKLNLINRTLVNTFNEFFMTIDSPIFEGEGKTEKWMEIYKRVKGEIRVALDELEDEFRRLLGDEGAIH
jgi:hypothetical protein